MAVSTNCPCSLHNHQVGAWVQRQLECTPSGITRHPAKTRTSCRALPTPDCSWSLGHTTNISPAEDRNGTRKIIFPWSKMASLLGTSSGLAIGKDRITQWSSGAGASRAELCHHGPRRQTAKEGSRLGRHPRASRKVPAPSQLVLGEVGGGGVAQTLAPGLTQGRRASLTQQFLHC